MSEDQDDINQDVDHGFKLVRFLDGPKKGESVHIPVDRQSIVVMKPVDLFDTSEFAMSQYIESNRYEEFVYKTVDIGGCCFAYCEGDDRLGFVIASTLIDWLEKTSKKEKTADFLKRFSKSDFSRLPEVG